MVINSLLNLIESGLNCNKCRLNCNKSAQIFTGHLFQMPMGNTNSSPMSLNPSRFATIKSWAAESPPSRTTLVVSHLRNDHLCHRHNGQHCSCWCRSRLSTMPPIDPYTRDLVIGRSWMFPFEFHQKFDTHFSKIFCLMAAVSRSDKAANRSIQKQL